MEKGTGYALEGSCDGGGRVGGAAEATGWAIGSIAIRFLISTNRESLGDQEVGKRIGFYTG